MVVMPTKVMAMTTSDGNELFINTKMLVTHKKKGYLKNTWSQSTDLISLCYATAPH